MNAPPAVLTVAGSDSSGGAGIQADLRTLAAHGVQGLTALTAVTAQSPAGIFAVHPVPPSVVEEQIRAALLCGRVAGAKTGMLWSGEIVGAVARTVQEAGISNLVVDPVLAASSGEPLMQQEGLRCLVEQLFPLARVVTPNLAEASALSGIEISGVEDMKRAAVRLKDMGPDYILITGGHLPVDPTDVLYDGASFKEFSSPRVASGNTHGTGCIFSAALAARLACGEDVPSGAEAAKRFVFRAIEKGLPPDR